MTVSIPLYRPELNARERSELSYAYAILEMARKAEKPTYRASGLAFDLTEELLRQHPDYTHRGGVIIPHSRAGLDTATATKGAELKFSQPQSWLDALRAQSVVVRAGASVFPGLQGDTSFPRLTTPTATVISTQNPGGDIAQADLALNATSLTLVPRTIMANTAYSRQLLVQSSVVADNAIDNLIMRDLGLAHAVRIDQQALAGTGAAGQATGLPLVAGVGSFAVGVNGGQLSWINVADLIAVALGNNSDFSDLGIDSDVPTPLNTFVTGPTIKTRFTKTDRAGAATGWFILGDEKYSRILSYPVLASTAVRTALVKGTSSDCVDVMFGRWSDLYVGIWGPGVEIVADKFSKKRQGLVEVVSWSLFDVGPARPTSFVVCSDARP